MHVFSFTFKQNLFWGEIHDDVIQPLCIIGLYEGRVYLTKDKCCGRCMFSFSLACVSTSNTEPLLKPLNLLEIIIIIIIIIIVVVIIIIKIDIIISIVIIFIVIIMICL